MGLNLHNLLLVQSIYKKILNISTSRINKASKFYPHGIIDIILICFLSEIFLDVFKNLACDLFFVK